MPTATRPDATMSDQVELWLEPGERWWGGAVEDGVLMPYGDGPFGRDLAAPTDSPDPLEDGAASNQSSPVLVSTSGRYVGSDRPFSFRFDEGKLCVSGRGVVVGRAGSTLREAFLAAAGRFFPPSGEHPAIELFSGPQYNTWIEQPYRPTQQSVLDYARGLLDAGMPPGVIIIDDSWAPDYGTWEFDPARFPDPREMTRLLHEWGFSIMLWLVPFVSPDSAVFRDLERSGLLIRDAVGSTAIRRWWNGLSALLDLTDARTIDWLTTRLDALVEEIGVDGFKFDAGDIRDYRSTDRTAMPADPVDLSEAWARLGLRYPFNEFRACWRMGGQPLGQRLRDKQPSWGADGIGSLIPELLAQGMIGHAFTCPDMIGGGEIGGMSGQPDFDQEFFVRYAQLAALSPMTQFSVAPPRVLDPEHLAAVTEALRIRDELMPTLLELVDVAARTGEPIVRPIAYNAPGLTEVTDQFFFGPDLIVAPIIVRGAQTRSVVLPGGRWQSDDGDILQGPTVAEVAAHLDRIPRFSRLSD